MSGVTVISRTQRIVVNPAFSAFTVVSKSYRIVISPSTFSVSVINAGPIGPKGLPGPPGEDVSDILTVDGELLTREGGVLAPITRLDLSNDPVFLAKYGAIWVDEDPPSSPTDGELWWDIDDVSVVPPLDPVALAMDSAFTSRYQPIDSDLTAIAALTTTAYGRALLTAANSNALAQESSFVTRYAPISQGAHAANLALITADQVGITSALTDLNGFTLTWTAVAGRSYMIQYNITVQQFTSLGHQDIKLFEGALDLGFLNRASGIAAGQYITYSGFHVIAPTAGAHTYKLKGSTTAGTMNVVGSSVCNGRFFVIDVG